LRGFPRNYLGKYSVREDPGKSLALTDLYLFGPDICNNAAPVLTPESAAK
jgi:hypothetical protein